ncbi:MAG: hypothetical protein FJ100_11460 [Deltaproteobacteria bacterium]|nr:hypothetical protein [Deltaproteobacteria bacterium]
MSDGGPLDPRVAVVERAGQRVLVARAPLEAGSVLCAFAAAADASGPGQHTLQVAAGRHVWLTPRWLAYVQHGCAPNVAFDVDEQPWQVRVLRPVAGGDALAAFYPATEVRCSEPFDCGCGALDCLGRIRGALAVSSDRWGDRPMSAHVRLARSWRAAAVDGPARGRAPAGPTTS